MVFAPLSIGLTVSGSLKVGEVCDVYPWPHRTLHNTGQTSIVLLGLLIPSTTPTLHISEGCWLADSVCYQATYYRLNWHNRIVYSAYSHPIVVIFQTIRFVPYLWDETRINQYLHCGSTVQIYTVTVYTLRNLAQSQESTTFSRVFYQGVNLLLPLCFPAWWWSPCSRRSRTCGGCWRGTAQSGCPPACPGSSCTSIAVYHQPGWKHKVLAKS